VLQIAQKAARGRDRARGRAASTGTCSRLQTRQRRARSRARTSGRTGTVVCEQRRTQERLRTDRTVFCLEIALGQGVLSEGRCSRRRRRTCSRRRRRQEPCSALKGCSRTGRCSRKGGALGRAVLSEAEGHKKGRTRTGWVGRQVERQVGRVRVQLFMNRVQNVVGRHQGVGRASAVADCKSLGSDAIVKPVVSRRLVGRAGRGTVIRGKLAAGITTGWACEAHASVDVARRVLLANLGHPGGPGCARCSRCGACR
jgi:hypothetical protein